MQTVLHKAKLLHCFFMKKLSLTEGPILRSMLMISIPIILGNILQSAYQITDTFWVGRLSAEAVAAVSLSFPISFLFISIGGGLPMAGAVFAAQYKGRGDMSAVNHVAAQTLILIMGIAIVLSGLGFVLAEPIMKFMGAAPNVLPDAVLFSQYTYIGYIFVFMYIAFESLMRGLGEVRIPMFIVLVTVILNFGLDPLFIFGYGPIPAMGVAGAAMATLCTQAVASIIGMAVLLSGKYGIHLRLREMRPDLTFIKKAFKIGFPASLEQSTRSLGMTVMTLLAASFGTEVVAAYGIGIRLLIVVIIPALGLSIATSTFVGQNIGAGRTDRAERATHIGAAVAFVVLSIIGVLLFFFARPLTVFFVPEGGAAIELSVLFTKIVSLTFGSIGVQMVLNGTFRGAGLTTTAMTITMISQWVIQFPLAYILSKHTSLGYEGIWWSFMASNIISLAISILWFMRGDWKRKQLLEDVQLTQKVRDELVTEEGIAA